MPSAFVDHLIKPLSLSQEIQDVTHPTQSESVTQTEAGTKEQLQNLLSSLNRPLSASLVVDTVGSLTQIQWHADISASGIISENDILRAAIVSKLLVGLYAEGIDSYLSQATDAETEAEWWADIERSSGSISFGQPGPCCTAGPSHSKSPGFPIIFFAYLSPQPLSLNAAKQRLASSSIPSPPSPAPECTFKRRELEKIRDQRAETLGYLAHLRNDLALAIQEPANIRSCAHMFTCIAQGDIKKAFSPLETLDWPTPEPLNELLALSTALYKTQKAEHQQLLESRDLLRPSRLTLIWPRLLLLPPLCFYALRSAYASRASLAEFAIDAKATAEGFVRGWLLDPLKDVVKTVRAGSEDGVIVQKEGIAADIASLERMTLSLAKDQLNYNNEQLANLSQQIRLGDLTQVLQIYEEDIRSPLKSAVTGNLLRSVFIQVQKAKVDIDQTLSGIDKLLKSQELTFAFVGVAPALGIVYLLGGTVMALWSGGRGVGRYGGKRNIRGVWSAMRRTERLLISQPKNRHPHGRGNDTSSIPPLTSGLLLLSVARLRAYAEKYLPPRSRLRDGFLEDVGDLENPDLGKLDKMKVIERMWRCWGETLGWGSIAVGGASRS
ncbi:hypothetical protein H0H87_011851 [Tephrocybe sp. NHM501043]|nr:hypothetical protein H0H87_011851 [Tephrocybe sp. NHM501043]